MSITHEVAGLGDSTMTKFLWGGLGGLAPYVATLPFLGVDQIAGELGKLDYAYAGGYALHVTILFAVGGIWVLLHKSESEPMKLFQLGIVAPAMITGMLSASHVDALKSGLNPRPEASFSLSLISPAYAQSAPSTPPAPAPSPPADSLERFVRGLLGR